MLIATKIGGDDRIRTDYPLRAKQVLYQMSYAPQSMVGLSRLERLTSPLSAGCSNRLSYRPRQNKQFKNQKPTNH